MSEDTKQFSADTLKEVELRIAIDENNLMEEWRGQAEMMLNYSVRLADARQAEDEARSAQGLLVAELDLKIRDNPDEYGLQKITESGIFNAIKATEEHQASEARLNAARHEVRVLQAVVDALDHRKRSLQGMTDLWQRQYFSDPKSREQPAALREATAAQPPSKQIPGRRVRRPDATE